MYFLMFMKKSMLGTLSLFFVFALFFFLHHDMQAAPIYAALWEHDNHKVYVYGDLHNTNDLFTEGQDAKLAIDLINTLGTSKEKILLLLESGRTKYAFNPQEKDEDGFLPLLNIIMKKNLFSTYTQVKDVDSRGLVIPNHTMLDRFSQLQNAVKSSFEIGLKN